MKKVFLYCCDLARIGLKHGLLLPIDISTIVFTKSSDCFSWMVRFGV